MKKLPIFSRASSEKKLACEIGAIRPRSSAFRWVVLERRQVGVWRCWRGAKPPKLVLSEHLIQIRQQVLGVFQPDREPENPIAGPGAVFLGGVAGQRKAGRQQIFSWQPDDQ